MEVKDRSEELRKPWDRAQGTPQVICMDEPEDRVKISSMQNNIYIAQVDKSFFKMIENRQVERTHVLHEALWTPDQKHSTPYSQIY